MDERNLNSELGDKTPANEINLVFSDGVRYSVDKLIEMARLREPKEIPILELQRAMEEECWEDLDGKKLKPKDVLEAIRGNEEEKYSKLKRHIDSIKKANLKNPILAVIIDGELVVVDGMHRLAKLFLEQNSSAQVIKFESFPAEAKV